MLLCECFPTFQRNYFPSTHRERLNTLKFPEIHRKRRFIIALTKAGTRPTQMNSLHAIESYLYKIHVNVISHLLLAVSSDLVPSGSLTKFCMLKLPPRFTPLIQLAPSSLL